MLTYIQTSDSKNAVDDATKMIDFYVSRVKNLPEVEAGYITLGDWIDSIKEDMAEEIREEITESVTDDVTKRVTDDVTKKVTEQNIKIVIGMFQEYHDTKEQAVVKLCNKFLNMRTRRKNW